jgi:hypothetical protein
MPLYEYSGLHTSDYTSDFTSRWRTTRKLTRYLETNPAGVMGAVRAPLVAQASGGDSTTGHLVLISLAWPALDSIKTMLLQHLDLANEECIGLDSFESRTEEPTCLIRLGSGLRL